MKRRLVLLTGYFALTPLILLFIIFYSLYLLHETNPGYKREISFFTPGVEYKALPKDTPETTLQVESEDARIAVLKEFFHRHASPLEPYAKNVVELADKYSLDYRLLPAIAMQESNLCKKIPKESHNCWGFGIYGGKITRFDSYPEALETISKTLSEKYVSQGYTDPHEIMQKYTPSSNGSWAESVTFFMEKIEASL